MTNEAEQDQTELQVTMAGLMLFQGAQVVPFPQKEKSDLKYVEYCIRLAGLIILIGNDV